MADTKENRCRAAREMSGLSVGQAAKLLGVDRAQIESRECSVGPVHDETIDRMALLYHVGVDWMLGDIPRYDYAGVRAMKGAERLTPKDLETVAEFAAAIRGTRPAKTLAQIRAEREQKP